MKKNLCCVTALVVLIALQSILYAECTGSCTKYCGSGYCTDYIEFRLKVRQSGNAGNWTGDLKREEVRPNDVAIFGPTKTNSSGHVAVVDSVSRDEITISEWNYGSVLIDKSCGVTNEFNKLHSPRRTISKSSVTRFWRPPGSSTGSHNPSQLPYRKVANVAWHPPNKSCILAERWKLQDGNGNWMSVGSSDICYSEQGSMIAELGWDGWDILIGLENLDKIKQCKATN